MSGPWPDTALTLGRHMTRLLALTVIVAVAWLWHRHIATVRRWRQRDTEPDLSRGIRDPWSDWLLEVPK